VIELRGISYRYPGFRRPAIQDVSLRLEDGEVVGLTGPNDAGKSTLSLVASGLAPASIGGELTGEVLLDGRPIARLAAHELAGRIGIVFSNPAAQLSGITANVFEEVAFGPVNLGLPAAESRMRARHALAMLEIEDLEDRAPERLSGGQTQLVAIASIVAMHPSVLVLDEPVAELDPDGRRLVGEALHSLARAGTSMLVAEHDLELLASISNRIVRIEDGRLVDGRVTGAPR
jgi:energy-coupling factor transporter ATP-binding protein EcfA2